MAPLREAFLNAIPEGLRAEAEAIDDLEASLARWVDADVTGEARDDPASFMRWIAARLDAASLGSMRTLPVEDLALAWRCAVRAPAALESFRRLHDGRLRAAVTRTVPSSMVEEVVQRVWVKLFVSEGEDLPTIAKYNGRGSLAAWVTIVGVREARSMLRRDPARHHVRADDAERLFDGVIDTAYDAELEQIKSAYRAQFKVAFQEALTKLSPRHRNILRHEHLDGLEGAQIAVLYGVHKATLYRWREQAREILLKETRRVFEQKLDLSRNEFDSVLRLIQSQLEVSLPRVLGNGVHHRDSSSSD